MSDCNYWKCVCNKGDKCNAIGTPEYEAEKIGHNLMSTQQQTKPVMSQEQILLLITHLRTKKQTAYERFGGMTRKFPTDECLAADAIEQLMEAQLKQSPIGDAPEGFALVPIKATNEMILAANALYENYETENGEIISCAPPPYHAWPVMIAAAPATAENQGENTNDSQI